MKGCQKKKLAGTELCQAQQQCLADTLLLTDTDTNRDRNIHTDTNTCL